MESLGQEYPRALVGLAQYIAAASAEVKDNTHFTRQDLEQLQDFVVESTEALAAQDTVKMLKCWQRLKPFRNYYQTMFIISNSRNH